MTLCRRWFFDRGHLYWNHWLQINRMNSCRCIFAVLVSSRRCPPAVRRCPASILSQPATELESRFIAQQRRCSAGLQLGLAAALWELNDIQTEHCLMPSRKPQRCWRLRFIFGTIR